MTATARLQGSRHCPRGHCPGSGGCSEEYNKLALGLYQKGYEPIPIKPGQKYPTIKGWRTADCSKFVTTWPKDHGVGLRTGKVTAIDIDVYHAEVVDALVRQIAIFPDGDFLQRVGQPPKVLIPVICPELKSKMVSNKWVDAQGVINQIEILSHGQQFVAYGIHPGTKKHYEWSDDLLSHSLPTLPVTLVETIFEYFDQLAEERGWTNLSKKEKKAKKEVVRRKTANTGDMPGEIYNRSVSVETVLEHYGWTHYQGQYWTRPGKDRGVSGSVLGDIFWCFTSSTCLEPESANDAFEVLAQYEFGGDKSACARALHQMMREVAA